MPPSFLFGHRGLTWGIPYGYNSHRSRLGRDHRRKLFRKTSIANDVAGALHPVVDSSDSDTGDLFTFLTLARPGPLLFHCSRALVSLAAGGP